MKSEFGFKQSLNGFQQVKTENFPADSEFPITEVIFTLCTE
jgi:hypothetical protein